MKMKSLLIGLSLVLLPALTAHAQDSDSAYRAEVDRWSQKRQAWLTNPDGYMSLTGLHWVGETPQTFEGIGEAHLEGDDVVFKFQNGVTLDGKPVSQYRVGPDSPRGKPDFRSGSSHFFVIRHGSRVAVRVKDPGARTLKEFTSFQRFPVDPAWRVVGRFEADRETIPVASVVEVTTDEVSPGYAVFDWGGKTHKLRLMGEETDPSYFLVFSDETAGKTTYSGCRFLDVEKTSSGELVLDFNKSENPPCSMTPFATCPLPPKGNILPFAVEAGEMTPKAASH